MSMDDNITQNPDVSTPLPEDVSTANPAADNSKNNKVVVISALVAVILLAVVVLAVWFLMADGERTQQIRDIFIIFMALESLLVGFVLVILVVQLARLINLLQNEVKPILESTNETVSTLRGTTIFLSDHLAEPIIQLNGYLAALQKLTELFSLSKKK